MGNLFIPVTYGAEAAFNDLRAYYTEEDYNAKYLRAFETYLSPLLSTDFLVNDEKYREISKQYPLPPSDQDNQYIPEKAFLLYMRCYERIMRERHIVGGWEEAEQSGMVADDVVDPLAGYEKRRR